MNTTPHAGEPLTYYLLDGPLTSALAAFRPSTGALVYLGLARDKAKLRKALARDFTQLARRSGSAHPLRHGGDPRNASAGIAAACEAITALLAGGDISPPVPTEYLFGTPFQRRVWDAMARIPRGETRTYGALAAEVGRPRAARAVGQACGANQLALVVPCHRVLPVGGTPGAFRWGAALKQQLLSAERAGKAA